MPIAAGSLTCQIGYLLEFPVKSDVPSFENSHAGTFTLDSGNRGTVLAGIELMHMIRTGQLNMEGSDKMSFADQFYALAGQLHPA